MDSEHKPNRDPNRARSVLVHPQLHLQLATDARKRGVSIQEQLHLTLCEVLDRQDLKLSRRVPMTA